MKLPILVAAHRRAERGELDLDRPVTVHDDLDSVVPGVRFRVDPARTPIPRPGPPWGTTYRCAASWSGWSRCPATSRRTSSSSASACAEVAAVLADAGCSERTQVVRGIEDYAARDAGTDNLVTADDLSRLMVALAEGRLAGASATDACERTLLAQTYRDGIPAGLPGDLVVSNKTGWIDGVNHDVALVRAPGPATGRARRAGDGARHAGRARGRDRPDHASRLGGRGRRRTRSTMTR